MVPDSIELRCFHVCVNWVACILEKVRLWSKSSSAILWELTCDSHQEVFVLQKFLHQFHVTTSNGLLISYVSSLYLYNLYHPSFPSSYPIFPSFSSMHCIVYGARFVWNALSHHFSSQKEATWCTLLSVCLHACAVADSKSKALSAVF